jgi:hypothetical protein
MESDRPGLLLNDVARLFEAEHGRRVRLRSHAPIIRPGTPPRSMGFLAEYFSRPRSRPASLPRQFLAQHCGIAGERDSDFEIHNAVVN